jgi:hypothetical protein
LAKTTLIPKNWSFVPANAADMNQLPRYAFTMRPKTFSIGLIAVALLGVCSVRAQSPAATSPTAAKDSLVVTADHYHAPITLSAADFSALPHVMLTAHNSHTNADETYSGVPLATLLAKVNAPMGSEFKGATMTTYVVATGSDNYSVVLSLAEVDPSFHGGQVIVADARDGQPLATSGPFELIVSDDKRPARWVHNLVAITLRNAQ